MKIGCNLSNQLIELIQENAVSVDYVKIALNDLYDEIPVEYKQYGGLMLHGVGLGVPQNTGSRFDADEIDWEHINRQLEFCGSPHLALHCESFPGDWDTDDFTYDDVKKRMSRFIQAWKANISVDILIENVPYRTDKQTGKPAVIEECVNPRLIRELCYENNIGLCLDLAHAKVAAYNLGIPLKEYLEQLPLELVREMHLVGPRMVDGEMRDNHIEMDETDYEILEWVLPKTNTKYLTLEYGGFGEHFAWRSDKGTIYRQLCRIREVVG